VRTTDARNKVFAFARDGTGSPEDLDIRLARHLAGTYESITGAPPTARTCTCSQG
jgi:hypothetical protein